MNVQNIPRSDKVIKTGFIPKRDCFLFFDYKAIEYRLLAWYLAVNIKDESMAEVFRQGLDVHAASAAALFNKPIEEVTEEERDFGKTFNFLTIYGGGAAKAGASLNISLDQARGLQTKFHESWPAIKKLHNPPFRNGEYRRGEGPGAIQRQLKRNGFIKTPWGRHLHPHSPHVALNDLIQGCAADLMRHSMVKVHKAIMEEGLNSRIVNVIHDELMFDVEHVELPWFVENVPSLMVYEPINEVVPIEVDTEYSDTNWAEKRALPRLDGRADHLVSA